MQAGNAFYHSIEDLPQTLPILAQPQLMLLPNGFLPVTIEDANFIQMINDALRGDRLIGVAQPVSYEKKDKANKKKVIVSQPSDDTQVLPLYGVGCMGRITNYSEIGDGSLLISLQGVCRFRLCRKVENLFSYPLYEVEAFAKDLEETAENEEIDRETFLSVFRNYLDINNMQADWETILEAPDDVLINALSIIAPFEISEKQALLEAADLKLRSEILIAIAERHMMPRGGGRLALQ